MSVRAEPVATRGRLLERAATAMLERALAGLEGGTLEVELPAAAPFAASARARRSGSRSTTWPSSGGSRPAASSASGSRTPPASGTRTTSSRCSSCCCGTRDAAGRAPCPRAPAARAAPAPAPAQRAARSRRNIAYHYDLGNDLFALMLDETMTYSCAVFERPEMSLAEAQRAKYERLCRAARARPGRPRARDRLRLGRLRAPRGRTARLPRHRDHDLARAGGPRARADARPAGRDPRAGLPHGRGQLHEGRLDRDDRGDRRRPVRHLLRDDRPRPRARRPRGGADDPRPRAALGPLPPHARLDRALRLPRLPDPVARERSRAPRARHSRLGIYGVDEIGEHYAETLRRWRASFHRRIEEVRALGYDHRFERTWDFYLAFCEAAFRMRALRDAQLLLARPGSAA